MAGENLGNLVEHAVLLAVDLQLETVLARKGNLHPREKSRQQQHYDDQDDGGEHRFQFLSLGSTETCSSRRTGRASSREPSRIFSGRRSTSASGLPTCLSAGPAGISRAGAALPDSDVRTADRLSEGRLSEGRLSEGFGTGRTDVESVAAESALCFISTSIRPFMRRKRQSLNSSSDSKPSPMKTSRPLFCTIFESTFE